MWPRGLTSSEMYEVTSHLERNVLGAFPPPSPPYYPPYPPNAAPLPPPLEPPSSPPGGCHPAGSLLSLEDGTSIAIEDAAVGTLVKTPTGYEPVLGWLHHERDMAGVYLELTAGKRTLSVSSHHLVVANGRETDPAIIRAGDVLHTPDGGNATVTRVRLKLERSWQQARFTPSLRAAHTTSMAFWLPTTTTTPRCGHGTWCARTSRCATTWASP